MFLFSIGVLIFGLPHMDRTANALRPRNSSAYSALDEIKTFLNQKREPLWLLVGGQTEAEVARRLDEVQPALARAVPNNAIASFTLPTSLSSHTQLQPAIRA